MQHRLDPLLRPRSVAVVGASARKNSMGEWALKNLFRGRYTGGIYPINPGYDELQGIRCFPALATLPQTPDLVIFAISDRGIEASLDEAIAIGVPAAVIMSPLYLDDDRKPDLKTRVQAKIERSGMLVCGANGMGFYNFRDGVWACGFDSRRHLAKGNVSLISQSGSGMSGIIDCEERLRVNVAVSTGNELSVSMDQYLDFVLDLPETKAVGLFIETARDPDGFRAALWKALSRKIPIVALKVGRSTKSAELAVSHSGAMAGVDATYAALFDRYGVHRVDDMDEFATALILFSAFNPLGPGGLVTLHDSGGERQLIVDLACDAGVPLPELSGHSVKALEQHLDPELPAVNPLDAWSRGGPDAGKKMADCLAIMMQDDAAAMGAVIHDRAPDGLIYKSYVGYMEHAGRASGKPVALVAARQGTGVDSLVVDATHRGFPVLDGVTPFLKGIRGLMRYRDFLASARVNSEAPPAAAVRKWQNDISRDIVLDEATSLNMLSDFGIPVTRCGTAESSAELSLIANEINFPVALKTAASGISHKSDHQGVVLDIEDEASLELAYADLAERLGPSVIVSEMVVPGVEMILGARRDQQFGPVVIMGFGGTLAEVLHDIVFALPPFDATYARRRIDELRLRPVLDGVRGSQPAAIDAYCHAAARFSVMVNALAANLQEIDVNPVIVGVHACTAVDALVVCNNAKGD
ncbi:MAG: acetate--CoA ligase family protein [Woeseiaceae bacterium]